ncbi:23S rRNA (adenine(2503)-C(2))-methyltransferase RlmN [Candidatus Peregrinibacteria bacterium]|nr:23S rRNA (adenine(2503)-C(2))-methyltransferase RlmN [Candidatus Peregrinibacteria bacterium]
MRFEQVLKNEPAYRIRQARGAIFQKLISDWSQATNMPKNLRDILNEKCPLEIDAEIFKSKDKKTVKALMRLADGEKIECVLMRYEDREEKNRNTVCVSTQIGCALGCTFCATGKMGFKRNLTEEEIINQILFFSRKIGDGGKITNVVFMGMGEPFLNYENVISAIKYLNDKSTMGLGMRRFSISTAGIPEGIKRFADENIEVNLALSLHAPNDELRSKLMPINKKYPINEVLHSLQYYQNKTRRKIMFEYIMIDRVNDSDFCANQLAGISKKFICAVNLIPYNTTGIFRASPADRIKSFRGILEQRGVETIQRFSFGKDIKAACGQLAGEK